MEENSMCRVISVANQKGGVAKSTTTLNLGVGLARQGKKVLLIDADPQGSLTASLGYVEPDDIGTIDEDRRRNANYSRKPFMRRKIWIQRCEMKQQLRQ